VAEALSVREVVDILEVNVVRGHIREEKQQFLYLVKIGCDYNRKVG